MLKGVYSIRDIKASEYLGLVLFGTVAEAQRFFLLTITDRRGTMWKFPKDYAIHEVGTYDVQTGVVSRREPVPADVTPYSAVDSFLAFCTSIEKAMENANGKAPKSNDQVGS